MMRFLYFAIICSGMTTRNPASTTRSTSYASSLRRKIFIKCRTAPKIFVDFLVKDPNTGYMVVTPSNSPENSPKLWKGKSNLFAGVTMDNQLVFDLFSNTNAAAQILNRDKQFCDTILSLKKRLPPMQVGQYGQLQRRIVSQNCLSLFRI